MRSQSFTKIEVLKAARCVANHSQSMGLAPAARQENRVAYTHLGAVLADSVLQAGLRYSTVVRPRIDRILNAYPEATTSAYLIEIVRSGMTMEFLNWRHHTKANRFNGIVAVIYDLRINDTAELSHNLSLKSFCSTLRTIRGVGPKTVDYMACLTGVDSIAVDRHIRGFAKEAGLESSDYDYLKEVFCYAADLLEMPRREFDAWVWGYRSKRQTAQLSFEF